MPANNDLLNQVISEEKRKAIGTDAKWTAIALTALSFFFQQVTLNLTKTIEGLTPAIENASGPGNASIGDYLSIWNVFWTSAPLIVGLIILYVWWKSGGLNPGAPGAWIAATLVLGVAAAIGNSIGFRQVELNLYRYGSGPQGMFASMLSNYASGYGVLNFISSFIVAVFLARTYNVIAAD